MIKAGELFTNEGVTSSDRSIHTPGAFAKQNLLYVQEVGRLKSLTPHRCVRENLDSYLFMIVLEGKGTLVVGNEQHSISKNDCALIDCRQHYEHISDAADSWRLAWVHFNGNIAGNYYDQFIKYNKSNVFTVDDCADWNELIGQLLGKQSDKSFVAELECGELLLSLMNKVIAQVADVSLTNDDAKQTATKVREFLNDNYSDRDVLKSVENALDYKLQEINDIFTRFVGISVEEYVSNRRMNAAKELLRFSDKPIEQVAEESGIGDTIVLQQMFLNTEGMSAKDYRRMWSQWVNS